MVHASLFSGIGGPEVAAAMMGWENAFHCEINPFGRAVLEYWFPESKSYEDITKTDFREWRGKIDILTGGFPCQPFSYAGKRGGREDERYLWPQMLRAIDEIRPTWVVGENVAGITTMVEGGVLSSMGSEGTLFGEMDGVQRYGLRQSFTIERICRDLENLGYSVQPVLIPAAAVGAPHRRDRIFIIAHNDRNGNNIDGGISERKVSGEKESKPAGYGSRVQYGEGFDLRRAAENTIRDGCCQREYDQQGNQRDERHFSPGDSQRLCEETWINASSSADNGRGRMFDGGREGEIRREMGKERNHTKRELSAPSNGIRRSAADTTDLLRDGGFAEHRGEPGGESLPEFGNGSGTNSSSDTLCGGSGEISSQVHAGVADGSEPFGDGRKRDAPHADCQGREEPQQPRRGEDSPEEEAGMDDRTVRPRRDENFADTYASRLSAAGKSRVYDEEERHGARRPAGMPSYDAWAEGSWWDNFPTVSPVHRGNDGLPFPVGDLTISFSKWRTESLKAYGNAIVPQVMYRIFQAIESATK